MADNPSEKARAAEAQVKGTKIKSKLAFVENTYGEETLQRVVEKLSPEDRRVLKSVLDVAWYPIDLYYRLLEAIVEVAGAGDPRVLDRMGREAAEYQAEHAYGAYFRSKDPRSLLESMIPMHAQINKPGTMEIVDGGERRLSLVIGAPPTTLLACRVAKSFYQRAVELVGGSAARVVESACQARGDGHCRFDVRW